MLVSWQHSCHMRVGQDLSTSRLWRPRSSTASLAGAARTFRIRGLGVNSHKKGERPTRQGAITPFLALMRYPSPGRRDTGVGTQPSYLARYILGYIVPV